MPSRACPVMVGLKPIKSCSSQIRAVAGGCTRPTTHQRSSQRLATRLRASPQQTLHWTSEVAMLPLSPKIEVLIKVLQAQGQSLVEPADRAGLHPLLVPLTEQREGGRVTCLLRWPEPQTHKDLTLPVVSMARSAPTLCLLARSPEEYLHRALAEEDSRQGQAGAVAAAAAAGSEGGGVYEQGAVSSSGVSLEAYLTRKAGMFPDVAEALALGHWGRGDTMSALITAEWYMRRLPDWGRPFEFASQLLQQAGRPEEARDTARVGLRQPWWTFQGGYAGLRDQAGLSGGLAAVRGALEEQDTMSNVGNGMIKTNPKSDKQVFLEEASWLLNSAAAGEAQWDEIRRELADTYSKAGLSDVARFILAA